MSYQEKRTIVSLVSGASVLAAYCLYSFVYRAGDLGGPRAWAVVMLVFIGAGIVSMIIIQIVFHILLSMAIAVRNRDCDGKQIERTISATMMEDEMDRLIELKASRTGMAAAGIGFVASLVSLVLGASFAVMLNILFLSFCAGSLCEGIGQLYFYRTGVGRG